MVANFRRATDSAKIRGKKPASDADGIKKQALVLLECCLGSAAAQGRHPNRNDGDLEYAVPMMSKADTGKLTRICSFSRRNQFEPGPNIEINLYGQNDPDVGIGTGLSDIEAGLRLRYEVRREIAPYIGVNWSRLFGNTADFAKIAGQKSSETQLVIGLRAWF